MENTNKVLMKITFFQALKVFLTRKVSYEISTIFVGDFVVEESYSFMRHYLYSHYLNRETIISAFTVINPTNDMETVGEKLKLSSFGEYCPDQSLRGYQLQFLLENNEHYKISEIVQRGKAISFNQTTKA